MANGTTWTVQWYEMRDGRVPLRIFLDSLPEADLKRAFALLTLLQNRGNQLREPHSKVVEPGLLELRGAGGSQVRMFYIFSGRYRAVVLDGILKKQDQIPRDVLDRMRAYRRDVESREKKAQ
jgi:phage-related protein